MKKTVIKFGLYSFVVASILFLCALVFGKGLSFKAQEIIGYTSIVVSLTFVFFGIKSYRDNDGNGAITFGKALGVGMLISLFAALGFAIIDFIYTSYINPDFVQEYMDHSLKTIEETYTGEELAAKKEELKSMEGMSSFVLALIMFATVTLIGFVISLVSSLVLNKK